MTRASLLAAVCLALAACDGGGDPVEQALRETAAANHAAAVRDQTIDPSRPSARRAADSALVAAMMDRNRRDLAQAETALGDARDPEVRRMARAIVETRRRELAELEAWRPSSDAAE